MSWIPPFRLLFGNFVLQFCCRLIVFVRLPRSTVGCRAAGVSQLPCKLRLWLAGWSVAAVVTVTANERPDGAIQSRPLTPRQLNPQTPAMTDPQAIEPPNPADENPNPNTLGLDSTP